MESMNGHVFECFNEQGNKRQYAKTVKALGGYAKKNLQFPDDFATLFALEASYPVIEKTPDIGKKSSGIDEMIFKEIVKEYVQRVRVLRRGNLAAI